MNTRARVFSNTIFSSLSIYVEYFLGMLTSIFIARYMGPSDFGVYGLILWLAGLGISMGNAGIASGMIKFIAELRGSGRADLLGRLVALLRRLQMVTLLVVGLAATAGYFLSGDRLASKVGDAGFILLLLSVALRAPYMLNVAVAKGFEDYRATAVVAAVGAPVNLAMIIAIIYLHAPMEWFVAVYAIMGLVFFAVSAWQIRGLVPRIDVAVRLPSELRSRIYRYLSLVVASTAVAFLSVSGVEVLFLNYWNQSADAGQFRVAYQLASSAALLVPGTFAATMLPLMSRSLSESAEAAHRRFVLSTVYLFILSAPLVVFGVIFAPTVIDVLYGPAYRPAALALAWFFGACAFTATAAGAASLLISAERQVAVLILMAANGAIKLSIGAFLTMRYGLNGAIASFVLVAFFNGGSQIWLAMRISKARIPWTRLLRVALAAGIAMLPAIAAVHWLPRWPALLVGGAALAISYAVATLATGCWDQRDIDYMRELALRFASRRIGAFDRAFRWVRVYTQE